MASKDNVNATKATALEAMTRALTAARAQEGK